jgi:hypothetical protein
MPAAVETLEDPQVVYAVMVGQPYAVMVGQPYAVAAGLLDRRRLLDRQHGVALAGRRRTVRLHHALRVLHVAVVAERLTAVAAAVATQKAVVVDTKAAVVVGTTSSTRLTE